MRALRFVALSEDGTHLVLAPDVPEAIDSGERFTVAVDDRMRAAARGDISRLGQIEIEIESRLRPKEIQSRIRAGETPESVAAAAGVRVERVMRYAWPVLQERQTIAERSQTARVKLDNTTQSPTLIELIEHRLLVGGGHLDAIDWDARRLDDGMWEVSSTWKTTSKSVTATWRYDVSTRTVYPGNGATVDLVDPAPRLVAVPTPVEDPSVSEDSDLDDAQTGPIPIIRDEEPTPLRRVRGRSRKAERQHDLFSAGGDDAADPGRSGDAHRRSSIATIEEPDGGLSALGLAEDDEVDRAGSETSSAPEPPDEAHPDVAGEVRGSDKKPRIPSWDDIVFGVKRRK